MEAKQLPLVSVILPVYNEQALLRKNVQIICAYLQSLESQFRWELLIVNDGSADDSGKIADELSGEYENLRTLHHPVNFGVGQALRFGFANTLGDYVVTMDVDLSYDVHHIEEMVAKLCESHAKIVLASPYMAGGSINNVPMLRKVLSIMGNRFLRFFSQGSLSTLTSMVRVYDGPFVRSMDLRSMGLDLMPECLYKAMVLRAKIVETPGRLDWAPQLAFADTRMSSMRILHHVNSTVMSGFAFRPVYFFILPGLLLAICSLYVIVWMFIHYFGAIQDLTNMGEEAVRMGAFAKAYADHPHTYVVGLLSTMLSVLLLGLGVLAVQIKRNFEEHYHLSSTSFRSLKDTMEYSSNE